MEVKGCSICGKLKKLDDFYSREVKPKKKPPYIYYHPECKSCTSEKAVKWQKENPDKRKEHLKRINATEHKKEMLRKSNRKRKELGKEKEWQQNNPDKLRKYIEKRKSKNHKVSIKEWRKCLSYFDHSCAYCGLHESKHFIKYNDEILLSDLHKEHVDHNGANDISNCVPSCRSCNSSKWQFDFFEWYSPDNEVFDEQRFWRILEWLESDHKQFVS